MHTLLTQAKAKFNPLHATAILSALPARVDAAAVLSSDGLVMVSTALPAHIDEDWLASLSAALFSAGTRSSQQLISGRLEHMRVQSSAGFLLINPITSNLVLSVLTQTTDGIDQLAEEVKQAAESIAALF